MSTVATVLLSVIFQLAFALYFKWQHKDEQDGTLTHNKNDDKWHQWGWVMRVLFFSSTIVVAKLTNPSWGDIALAGVLSAITYDVFINLFAISQKVFYPGSSSDYDKKFGKYKWVAYFVLLTIAIIYRIYENK